MADIVLPLGFSIFFLIAFTVVVPLAIISLFLTILFFRKLPQFVFGKLFNKTIDRKITLAFSLLTTIVIASFIKEDWLNLLLDIGPHIVTIFMSVALGWAVALGIKNFYFIKTGKRISKKFFYTAIIITTFLFLAGIIAVFVITLDIY